ncbi:MAG TPA: XF1762 family protein, partial [Planctomycetota bacterium]|nr:XF1762 family protein [Planctomycetota bacterium]
MKLVPMTISAARAVVAKLHRHRPHVVGGLFALGVADDTGAIRGAAIIGRPVARKLDDGRTCEVTRLAT